jgi:hypothetical protein
VANHLYADNTTGNNILNSGDGVVDLLSANNSSGDNTLNAGNGGSDQLSADNSTGNNTLNALGSGGSGDILSAQNSQGANHLNAGDADFVTEDIDGSSGNDVLVVGNGNTDILLADYTSGNVTLTAGNGSEDTLSIINSTGNDTLNAGSGGDDLNTGFGVDTLSGGTGNDQFDVYNNLASGSSITGGGGTDVLNIYSTADVSQASISSIQNLQLYDNTTAKLTASQLTSFTKVLGFDVHNTIDLAGVVVTGVSLGSGNVLTLSTTGSPVTVHLDPSASYSAGFAFAGDGDGGTDITVGGSLSIFNVLAANAATVAAESGVSSIAVYDTAANVVANLSSLQTLATDGKLSSIAFTNSSTPSVSLTSTQIADDATALGLIESSYIVSGLSAADATTAAALSSAVSVSVSDTAADVVSNLSALQTLAADGKLTGITLTDSGTPTISLTDAELTDDATALGLIASSYELSGVSAADAPTAAALPNVVSLSVSDTAANVAANIDALQTLTDGGQLSAITLTDSSTPTMSLTGTQLTVDSPALAEITSAYNLSISGGGTAMMGSAMADVENVTLQSASQAYNFTGNDDAGLTVSDFGSTDDSISVGNSSGENVIVGDTGVYAITTGTGNDDTVVAESGLEAGSSVTMNGTGNTLFAVGDISGATLTGVNDLTGISGEAVTVSAAELSLPGLLVGSGITLQAATGGTYDLTSSGQSGDILEATADTGTLLIGNDAASETLIASANGSDTLEGGNGDNDILSAASSTGDSYLAAGSGNNDVLTALGSTGSDFLQAGDGSDTFIAGLGQDFLIGGNGYDTYQFGASFGQDIVFNGGSQTTASGETDFTSSSVTDENLWFQQSGDQLVVDLLGTSDQVTFNNWFGSDAAQVQSFHADGLTLDTQISALVSAMATYASANPGFDPTTASSMPTDTTLQSAIASSWHS